MTYLLLVSVVLSIIVVWILGGKLSRLGEIKFRQWWIVPLVAAAQSIVIRFAHSPGRLKLWHPRPLVMIVSYLVLWAVVWRNRRLAGMGITLIGVTLNLMAIVANGGYMPISPEALARIGAGNAAYAMPTGSIVLGSKDILLSPSEARFWMLGDILVIPEPLPWPTAMSIGDVILAIGVFWFIARTTQPSKPS